MDVTAPLLAVSYAATPLARNEGGGRLRAGREEETKAREIAQKVVRLKEIDQKVRAHEAAHVAAAAGLVVQGARFHTVRGPDGNPYAVGGDVRIDISPGRTPEETLRKAEKIRAAALAPADPSPQDLKVAAQAAQMAAQARIELARQQAAEGEGGNGSAKALPKAPQSADPTAGALAEAAAVRSWRARQAVAAYLRHQA